MKLPKLNKKIIKPGSVIHALKYANMTIKYTYIKSS